MKEYVVNIRYSVDEEERCFINEKVADTEQEAIERAKALLEWLYQSDLKIIDVKVEEVK